MKLQRVTVTSFALYSFAQTLREAFLGISQPDVVSFPAINREESPWFIALQRSR